MKLGIGLTDFSNPVPPERLGPTIADLAQQADESGVDSLWVMDHFFQIRLSGLPQESPMFEAYATLGFLAGITKRIRLGTLVTSVAYRHPGVLLKSLTALDVLSGGRMYFGVGAGAAIDPAKLEGIFETDGLGIPFPSLGQRFEMLEELLQISHRMWDGDETPFHGKHYDLARPLNSPNSVQRPRPPILIAGSGERKTLRLVAQYGDACSLFDLPGAGYADDIAHKLEVLRAHCGDVGRDFDEIEKTIATHLDPTAENFVEHMGELAGLGIEHVMLGVQGPWDEKRLAQLAELLPEVHAL
ncbi:TIGR03560 family F420-dependent LLM class oxidoreductase [Nocardia sp. NEAU-G5]|uniref:TIGR03560 family F420-dependent LLM class oxidoreductase n=1 Tax=Nocardia albiluteola TaxID=2842303 RepID=A0ABS6B7A8_9NOCA|nr:LLM class F420-dependent oxidoreductase [Nocardia albiluteola]MBU3065245.1 TIGR03560 family F420-dependent LLM class oxidoreductase [Nocardia albiluteola]